MFSAEEDKAIWKFVIENLSEPDEKSIWDRFKVQTGSKRRTETLYARFHNYLLSRLSKTELPAKIKLQLCKKYEIVIRSSYFLAQLKKEAVVRMNDSVVVDFMMKKDRKTKKIGKKAPERRSNRERPQNQLAAPTVSPRVKHFTLEEDEAVWKHILENYETNRCAISFWRELAEKSGRKASAIQQRFQRYLSMKIHERDDFDIETTLRIYQWCSYPVNEEFLETLKDHVKVQMENGRVIGYEMIGKGREEHLDPDETKFDVKRAKNEEEVADDDEEDLEFENPQKPAINQKIDNHVVAEVSKLIKSAMTTFSGKLDCFHEELTAIKQNMTETSGNLEESVRNEIFKVSRAVETALEAGRQEIPKSVEEKIPSKMEYLQKLKSFLSSLNAPETMDIHERIDETIQNLQKNGENPIQMKWIRSSVETMLLLIEAQ